MKKRLFLYITLILLAGLLCYFAVSLYATHTNNLNFAKDEVTETAQICADLYADGTDAASLANAGTNTRITVIAPDGTVLADSRPLDMGTLENHLSRPEIQAALAGAPEAYVRYSETLGADLIYYALKVDKDDSYAFVRTAIPVAKIDTYLFQSLPLLILLLLLVVVVCFFFARSMINRIIKPFESIEKRLRSLIAGEYAPERSSAGFEEIGNIMRGIDEVAKTLNQSFTSLRDERNKLDYILNNIGDGLFVVDSEKNIVLINSAAQDVFYERFPGAKPDATDKNLNYLSFDKGIAAAVDDCVRFGKDTMFEALLNGRIYFILVKRLPETSLAMVVLSDVTENRENAKRREEFFANASHELKTPLTAIRGFNELSALNNKDEHICKYIDGIARETDRMLSLIGDMLKLSELENTQQINPVSVSLAKIAGEACETLSAVINEKGIAFELDGDAEIAAEPKHIYELLKNLIENAVRYTEAGGRVSVRIERGADMPVSLTVLDDGIGISPEEQGRIFERFYRVEKSRAQKNGGTGLGLSIVKHICRLYDWKLTLKSRPGVGTEVTVVFEKTE